ncbi:MAG: pseudouridine synthase [Myxococcaceae bacterium]
MPRRRETKWLTAARARDSGSSGVVQSGTQAPSATSTSRNAATSRPDWIARALARGGALPLREAEAAIRAGRVKVEGRLVEQPFAPYRPGQRVLLDGREIALDAATRVLAFHKPAGSVTAPTDSEGAPTVFDLLLHKLPADLRRFGWHAVGRLDRDTTGLLLFTNDERFVTFATSPSTHLSKRYLAHVQGIVEDAKLEPLRKGITLDDGPARPAKAVARGPSAVELTLTEGRHHQVKRMLGAIGLPVVALHREAVADFTLDVALGEWRQVAADEVREQLRFTTCA